MMCKVLLLALVGAACAASVEKRQGTPVAQARDGAHGHSGHGGGSSYAAPAPSSYDEGGSQGNLYYYYYPVSEYGSAEVAEGGFDVFAAVILPLLIIGGILLILSSLTFTLTNGRAMSDEPREASIVDELHDEIERVFYLYLNAFESEQCIQRTICQLGTYAKDFKGKNFVLSLVETLAPEGMKNNVAIFAKAAKSGYDTGKCKQFRCVAPKLLDN
ncbi:hypothetical protein O3P69_000025 [Scylla paramamosain]|uniref:Uncharacterized protein n=1 Tax=Scylla paramamosain TaxID=85552 RepID=A0AAW0UU51_SCYPA